MGLITCPVVKMKPQKAGAVILSCLAVRLPPPLPRQQSGFRAALGRGSWQLVGPGLRIVSLAAPHLFGACGCRLWAESPRALGSLHCVRVWASCLALRPPVGLCTQDAACEFSVCTAGPTVPVDRQWEMLCQPAYEQKVRPLPSGDLGVKRIRMMES